MPRHINNITDLAFQFEALAHDMSIEEAEELLGLVSGKYNHRMLKGAFRRAILKHHPDTNKELGADELTRKIIAAYNRLETLPENTEVGRLIDMWI